MRLQEILRLLDNRICQLREARRLLSVEAPPVRHRPRRRVPARAATAPMPAAPGPIPNAVEGLRPILVVKARREARDPGFSAQSRMHPSTVKPSTALTGSVPSGPVFVPAAQTEKARRGEPQPQVIIPIAEAEVGPGGRTLASLIARLGREAEEQLGSRAS
jgi:hypothetical protein